MYKIKRKDFYSKIETINNKELLKMLAFSDPARIISVIRFHEKISELENFSFKKKIKVAIISGTKQEPELFFFENAIVEYLSFEENIKPGEYQFWDLNWDWSQSQYSSFHNKYDLVLCEQVFEHIPDPENALKNLKVILKDNGIIHISVPCINGIHTDPYYFSAGYHNRMLEYLANKVGEFKILDCDSWGTKKAVSMYAICDWTPLVSSGDLRDNIRISYKMFNFKKFIKYFYHKIKYNFSSIWHYQEIEFPVISWILLQKK